MGKYQKALWVVSLLAVFSLGASPYQKSRLTVINKSGMKIALELNGVEEEAFYYLPVSAGDQAHPKTQTFTVVKDRYSIQVYFIEAYDPVYGYTCPGGASSSGSTSIDANHNVQLVVKACTGQQTLKHGEKSRSRGGSPLNRLEAQESFTQVYR